MNFLKIVTSCNRTCNMDTIDKLVIVFYKTYKVHIWFIAALTICPPHMITHLMHLNPRIESLTLGILQKRQIYASTEYPVYIQSVLKSDLSDVRLQSFIRID